MPRYEVLPEYQVSLSRVPKREKALPNKLTSDHLGLRTKLGGEPNWDEYDERPTCAGCDKPMSFVAQIDSIEHDYPNNPNRVDCFSKDQKWMFGDVGMIYVFFCFNCLEAEAVVQFG